MKTKQTTIEQQLALLAAVARKRAERPTGASNGEGGQPSSHDNKKPPQDDK